MTTPTNETTKQSERDQDQSVSDEELDEVVAGFLSLAGGQVTGFYDTTACQYIGFSGSMYTSYVPA